MEVVEMVVLKSISRGVHTTPKLMVSYKKVLKRRQAYGANDLVISKTKPNRIESRSRQEMGQLYCYGGTTPIELSI